MKSTPDSSREVRLEAPYELILQRVYELGREHERKYQQALAAERTSLPTERGSGSAQLLVLSEAPGRRVGPAPKELEASKARGRPPISLPAATAKRLEAEIRKRPPKGSRSSDDSLRAVALRVHVPLNQVRRMEELMDHGWSCAKTVLGFRTVAK